MLKKIACAALLALFAATGGCTFYGGSAPAPQDTLEIVLKENDFKTVKTHLVGESSCFYVLHIAFGDPNILSKAQGLIRDQAQLDNRSYQLVNWTKDEIITNYFIAFNHSVKLTADVIEFTK